MITQERFTALYIQSSEIFDSKDEQFKRLEIKDNYSEIKASENNLNTRGCFRFIIPPFTNDNSI